ARYAYALDLGCFERFEAQFCACFGLGAISLSHIRVRNPDSAYYTGSIVTGSGNTVTVHSGSLAGMLYLLSRKTVQDLIALEFGAGRSFDRTAQSLLSASSVLNIMARALDEGFIPVHKLRGSQSPAEKAQAGTL